jgi:selenide,water dikinase
MRCGGCGAKVGSAILWRVLERLQPVRRDDVLMGLQDPDDAAVTITPEGKVMVHTVDFFRPFIDDPYFLGRIGANHCLGDIFAMGAQPQMALALAVVPFGPEAKVEEDLAQLLHGASEVLESHGVSLAGGHTAEGMEAGFGLSVTGLVELEAMWRKSGAQPGQCLILTKPLGTGMLFAADMRGLARGAWIEAALEVMALSHREAAECLRAHGATACTDVTGFGFLGHLLEMLRASELDASIDLEALPLLAGVLECARKGIASSMAPQNRAQARSIANPEGLAANARYSLLFDPQTAGGLLAAVPASESAACRNALRASGYNHAEVVGKTRPRSANAPRVTVAGGSSNSALSQA